MYFVNYGGLGKEFPAATIPSPTPIIWTEDRLRSVLVSRGVWPSSISGNVEYWYPQVLADVQAGIYTFEEFVEEFANHEKFHFGETLERLREPASTFGGGWLLD
jgi:hypothetical protein